MFRTDIEGLVLVLLVTGFFFIGFYAGKETIKEDCESIKTFTYRDVTYECKVKQ